MNHVFQNAFCTISATKAATADDGFLRYENLDTEVVVNLNDIVDRFTGRVSLVKRREISHTDEPLNQRAWTLAERYLSPRLIDFTSTHLAWNCWHGHYPENDQFQPKPANGRLQYLSVILCPRKGEQIGEVAAMKIWETWVDIVHEYAHRVLTRGDDKLPAIASFAAEFQPIIGGKYFAGLWRRHLIPGLLWHSHTSSTNCYTRDSVFQSKGSILKSTRAQKYRAPTWSWASCDGPIFPRVRIFRGLDSKRGYDQRTYTTIEILDCAVTLDTPTSPFGQVTAGHLTVRG